MAKPSDCRKTLGEFVRVGAFNRARSVYGGRGRNESGGKSCFPERKSFPYSFCARKSERLQQNWLERPAGEQALHSPACQKSHLTGGHGEAVNLLPLWTCTPSPRFREELFFCFFWHGLTGGLCFFTWRMAFGAALTICGAGRGMKGWMDNARTRSMRRGQSAPGLG